MTLFPSRRRRSDQRTKRSRRGPTTLALLIIAGVAVGVGAASWGSVRDAVAPPATVEVATPQPRTAEEQAYLNAVLPLVERLVGEGRLLAELGSTRSRNLLELQARASRFEAAAAELRTVETASGVPDRLKSFSVALNAGIDSALVAVEEARAAVLRFDWDEVERAVATFSASVERIGSATADMEQA